MSNDVRCPRAPEGPVLISLSGGMDSATVLYYALSNHPPEEIFACSIDYGQTHHTELSNAQQLAKLTKIRFWSVRELPLKNFTQSALLNPTGRYSDAEAPVLPDPGVAPSWLPARNAILLSALAGLAYTLGISTVGTGVNAVDWSGYPDCTPEFVDALQTALQFALGKPHEKSPFRLWAPLLHLSKKEIVLLGEGLEVPWHLTWSCYNPDEDGRPCQTCGACTVRAKGFADANLNDPLLEEA